MSEMVERVAMALCDERWRGDWPKLNEGEREDWRGAARAAIAAMREPIEAMINSAHDRIAGEGEIADVWRAMIDEALRE